MPKKSSAKPARVVPKIHYTLQQEIKASPFSPMAQANCLYQFKQVRNALADLEFGDDPTDESWRIVSDAINLLETLVRHGEYPIKNESGLVVASHWPGCGVNVSVEMGDKAGLLQDAIDGMLKADELAKQGLPLRLDASGLVAVKAVLEDYIQALRVLPARTMIRCHRATEIRLIRLYGEEAIKGSHILSR